ncbi:MAG: rRNA maturation RNase YbeY [Betaproteobacteria bacterium]|nr:MAG: rRNA maturation RNase YbeY [Betaproteobacteria bacterium]
MPKHESARNGGPRIHAIDGEGKSTRVKAERLEVELSDGRRLLLSFPERAWGDLEIEAETAIEADTPVISVQPGACNLLTLRVDVLHDLLPVDDAEPEAVAAPAPEATPEPAPVRSALPPVLTLSVQRAVEGDDKANAPKKNHIRRWAQAALQGDAEVTVRFVGEEEGQRLNREFRGKDYATNVLTFSYGEGEMLAAAETGAPLTGDLVLCVPVVVREAAERGKTLEAHFAHLVVHGMLHLQGYDHLADAEAERMEALETQILRRLGYADPYA